MKRKGTEIIQDIKRDINNTQEAMQSYSDSANTTKRTGGTFEQEKNHLNEQQPHMWCMRNINFWGPSVIIFLNAQLYQPCQLQTIVSYY